MTRVSRKVKDSGEVSCVNLRVGCTVFRWFMKMSSCACPCGQIMKLSSIYLSHIGGGRWYWYMYFSSKAPMTRLAIVGATLVPMATPCVCRKCWPLNSKLLQVRTSSSRATMWSFLRASCVSCLCLCRVSRAVCSDSSLGMLVYNEVTSSVTSRSDASSLGNLSMWLTKSVVSFTYEGSRGTYGLRRWSTKPEMRSVGH